MGGVPVLVLVTLFGTLSAQPHLGVCISKTSDVQSFSETCLSGSRSGDYELVGEGLADPGSRHGVEVYFVADSTAGYKTTSSENTNALHVQQADDSSSVAIPELVIESPVRVLNAARNPRVMIMRKPDNSDAAGSGFSFPSVPPSLAETRQALAQNVDRAGRPIDSGASAGNATNGKTLPSTTSVNPPSFPVPPFTSSAGVASAGSAAANIMPIATPADPLGSSRGATTRTTNWGQFPLPTTAPTAPVSNPVAFGTKAAPAANAAASGMPSLGIPSTGTGRAGASPLLPTDTFGRTPTGLTVATGGRATQSANTNLQQSQTNPTTPGFMHVPATGSTLGRNPTASSNAATSFGAGSASSSTAGETTPTNNLNSVHPNSSGQAVTVLPVGQTPMGRFGANPSASFSQTSSVAYPAISSSAPAAGTGFSDARPDARLSAAQLAAGAWSVDAFGQPVDRTGQLIASGPAINHGQRRNEQMHPTGAAGFGHQLVNQTVNDMTSVRPAAVGQHAVPRGSMAVQNEAASKFDSASGNGKSNQVDSGLLAPRINGLPLVSETDVIETESVTTQPLFNGLLLISLVVNIYLIFWLKNLRLQYHEMVAAKRMASSNQSSS